MAVQSLLPPRGATERQLSQTVVKISTKQFGGNARCELPPNCS
jgi:hypothetical protein